MWKDITSNSRSEKERKPTSFEAKEGSLKIVITCGHIHYKPEWIMHCYAIGIDTHPLTKGITKEQAEAEAVKIVYDMIAELSECSRKLSNK